MLGFNIASNIAYGVHGIFTTGAEKAANFLGYDEVLHIASESIANAHQQAILTLVNTASRSILAALVGLLGPVESVIKYIMRNRINKETFDFIGTHWVELAQFMVDLLEPMKRYAPADSTTGDASSAEEEYNAYNELDLTVPMNRHAVICQTQRLGKSLIALFSQKHVAVDSFVMDTRLETDTATALAPMSALPAKRRSEQKPETWLFINGIAGEYRWTTASVEKIRDYFFDAVKPGETGDASVKGIFNRSDGMLWDLIECAGERRPEDNGDQPGINETTDSSRLAKNQLLTVLEAALSPPDAPEVVLITHSQGCLLTRLALDELHRKPRFAAAMKEKLNVFTFGNPAYDWDVHRYVKYTEHYANAADFVAKLGVLRTFSASMPPRTPGKVVNGRASTDPYYCRECAEQEPDHSQQLVFVNEKRKGHLFGSQYSLRAEDYECRTSQFGKSVLLSRARRGI